MSAVASAVFNPATLFFFAADTLTRPFRMSFCLGYDLRIGQNSPVSIRTKKYSATQITTHSLNEFFGRMHLSFLSAKIHTAFVQFFSVNV